jgi:hypothetical protein
LSANSISMILTQGNVPYFHGDQAAEDASVFSFAFAPSAHVHPGRVELAV